MLKVVEDTPDVKMMVEFLLSNYDEVQVAEALNVSTKSLYNYQNGQNPHKRKFQEIYEIYKKILEGGKLEHKNAQSFVTGQENINKTIFQVKAQNMVILSALAEILAKQNGQLVTTTLKQLEAAVDENYREIERLEAF